MPIYVYRCSSCDLQQDVLQKMSDAPLSVCPECGQQTFSKQLTAAGFQLKGNGYYVTDFKNGTPKPDAKQPDINKSDAKPDAKSDVAPAPAPTAPVPTTSSASTPAASGTV